MVTILTRKHEPAESEDSSEISASMRWASSRQIARPTPLPPGLLL